MPPSRFSHLLLLIILAGPFSTVKSQNRQDLSRLRSTVGQIVVLKIPESIIRFEKIGTWSGRPNFAVTIAPNSSGGLIVGGRANWKDAGLPPMGELFVAKVSRQKRLIEVELRSWMVNVKLRFTPDVPDLFAAFSEIAFLGSLNDFKASQYYREEVLKNAPQSSGIPAGPSARSIPTEVEKLEVREQQVISQAEHRFKEGELHLKAGERLQAREKFDKAVDTILESGLDVRASDKLQAYYTELVERIYRLEVPQQQVTLRPEQEPGFKQQKFELSPSDELSKLLPSADSTRNKVTPKCGADYLKNFQLRGLRLGMKSAEVVLKVNGLRIPAANEFGFSRATIKLVDLGKRNAVFKGLLAGSFEFVDGRLTSIFLVYDDSVIWNSLEEFLAKVSESLGIPSSWQANPQNTRLKSINCGDLRFTGGFDYIGYKLRPLLMVRDSRADALVTSRENEKIRRQIEKEEERRRTFKP